MAEHLVCQLQALVAHEFVDAVAKCLAKTRAQLVDVQAGQARELGTRSIINDVGLTPGAVDVLA